MGPGGIHRSRTMKLALLGCLYFSQGLPFGFFTQSLPVVLRKEGMSLGDIGLTSLLAIPWALKFLWAPLVDRFGHAGFGRRKTWIIPLQLITILVLGGFALRFATAPRPSLALLLAGVFVINFLSATQDIATDGLAVDVLARHERGLANGVQVVGYRVGMIVGGGALLILHGSLGMAGIFSVMALLVAVVTVPVLVAPEGAVPKPASKGSRAGRFAFFQRPGVWRILLIIATYKFGDALAQGMLRPFLSDLGLELSELGWMLGTVGFAAGLLGALAGGQWINTLGRQRALMWFGALQALAVAGYVALALSPSLPIAVLYAFSAIEHFTGGMATVALFTCMMDWSGRSESATDYTIQASAVVITTGAAAAISGFIAEALDYSGLFALATGLSALGVGVVWAQFPKLEAALPEAAGTESSRGKEQHAAL